MFSERGFTLIEILVAMAILGILTTSVVLVLPDSADAARRDCMRVWQAQAEMAAAFADAEARPWAWEIGQDGARLLAYSGTHWLVADGAPGTLRPLAAGMTLTHLEIDGQPRPLGSHIIFSGIPPLFIVGVAGGERRWQLIGQANGTILLKEN